MGGIFRRGGHMPVDVVSLYLHGWSVTLVDTYELQCHWRHIFFSPPRVLFWMRHHWWDTWLMNIYTDSWSLFVCMYWCNPVNQKYMKLKRYEAESYRTEIIPSRNPSAEMGTNFEWLFSDWCSEIHRGPILDSSFDAIPTASQENIGTLYAKSGGHVPLSLCVFTAEQTRL